MYYSILLYYVLMGIFLQRNGQFIVWKHVWDLYDKLSKMATHSKGLFLVNSHTEAGACQFDIVPTNARGSCCSGELPFASIISKQHFSRVCIDYMYKCRS